MLSQSDISADMERVGSHPNDGSSLSVKSYFDSHGMGNGRTDLYYIPTDSYLK
jgi:hypothetical protein